MRPHPVAITGLGLCTPLGDTLAATWHSLLAGESISDHSRVGKFIFTTEGTESTEKCQRPDLGFDLNSSSSVLSVPSVVNNSFDIPRVIELAEKAASEAITGAKWDSLQLQDSALIVGTSKGPIEAWLSPPIQRLELGLSDVASELAGRLKLGFAPRLTLSAACASGLHALIRGVMLLDEGCRRVIVVAAESSLHPLFLGSFQRLGVLAPAGFGCRPFDEDRAGFYVSEAAAAVCLERGDNRKGVQIERFAIGGDATHLTGGDPISRTMRRLLADVINNRPVDLIHAHGTGTVANDAVELDAIESVIAERDRPQLYSHKCALGHSLGAAGLISVVINCVCHEHGIIPPNVRTRRPLPMRRVNMSTDTIHRPIQRSIALASGFGGAAAAVSLRRLGG